MERKERIRDVRRAARVLNLAELAGVSTRQVRYVLDGVKTNHAIIEGYLMLERLDNQVLQAVKELVPFDRDYSKMAENV